jgi:predicted enzyme related to lactoylglutathione lyase
MGERTGFAEGTPSWVDLMTTDPEGARAFYSGLFGWEMDVSPDPNTGNYTTALLGGKRVAGLSGQPNPDGVPTVWTTYFAVDDVDKAADRVRENGGTFLMEPMSVLDSGRMAIAVDPTGVAFGMWQAGTHTGAELVNEPGTQVWNELATRSLDEATGFYTAVLGLTTEDLDAGESGLRYRTLHVNGNVVGGSLQMDDSWGPEFPGHWMTYFAVADTDAAVATAQALGGQVRVPPTDSPHGRFAVLSDPQGGAFTVIAMTNPDA